MSDCFFTPKELAARWKMTEQTLANWRNENRGPPYLKVSNRVLYRAEEIEEFEVRCCNPETPKLN